MQLVECVNDLIGQYPRQVAEGLPEFGRCASKIAKAVNHLQRDAEIRFHQTSLSCFGINKPLANPKREISERDLCC